VTKTRLAAHVMQHRFPDAPLLVPEAVSQPCPSGQTVDKIFEILDKIFETLQQV
jgi:hypothetical protein